MFVKAGHVQISAYQMRVIMFFLFIVWATLHLNVKNVAVFLHCLIQKNVTSGSVNSCNEN
ncbi:hypothetical protein CAF89_007915 [Enterobacter asburiae]|nr:hypothetical protein CAF89_007915 [Enterobacter asburiae]